MIDPTFLCQEHFAEFERREKTKDWDHSVDCILCEVDRLTASAPRCDTCSAWDGPDRDDNGWCRVLEHSFAPDFGCRYWALKGPSCSS